MHEKYARKRPAHAGLLILQEGELMKNPFKQARERLGLSMYDLAFMAGVSLHTIICHEKGVTQRPNEKLLNFFKLHGFNAEELKTEYLAWKNMK